jgi:hypothetical protein
MHHTAAVYALLAFMAIGTMYAVAQAGCQVNAYGRCHGQPYGPTSYGNYGGYGTYSTPQPRVQQMYYPHAAIQTPTPQYRQGLSPVEAHAQWQNNQRRYEEINAFYTRTPNGVGGYYTPPSAVVRPYPRYSDYTYPQARAQAQKWGTPNFTIYSTSLLNGVPTTAMENPYAFRTARVYITQQQADAYDKLYALGITNRPRPSHMVVGKRPQPHPPSRFGY